MKEEKSQLYSVNPLVCCPVEGGVIVKRASIELHIAGDNVAEILQMLIDELSIKPQSKEDLISLFPDLLHDSISELIDELFSKRLIVNSGDEQVAESEIEDAKELFFWEFGINSQLMSERLESQEIYIVGVNSIAKRIVRAMLDMGFKKLFIVNAPDLANIRFMDAKGNMDIGISPELVKTISVDEFVDINPTDGLLLACSDFGGMHLIRPWNEYAVTNGMYFMSTVLQSMIGYVGPFVVPGETPCFECLRARQNSHMDKPEMTREPEKVAFETQLSNSFLPSMTSLIADLTVIEVTKFIMGRISEWKVGSLLEIDLLKPELNRRKVLKIPRCSICGDSNKVSSASIDAKLFIPHQVRAV